jgi:hypothetical protein
METSPDQKKKTGGAVELFRTEHWLTQQKTNTTMKILYANTDQPVPAKYELFEWYGGWLVKDDGAKAPPKGVFVMDFIEFEEELWWLCTTNRPQALFAVQNFEPKGRCMFFGFADAPNTTNAEMEQMYAVMLTEAASLGPSTKLVLSTVPLVTATLELVTDDVVGPEMTESQTIQADRKVI